MDEKRGESKRKSIIEGIQTQRNKEKTREFRPKTDHPSRRGKKTMGRARNERGFSRGRGQGSQGG